MDVTSDPPPDSSPKASSPRGIAPEASWDRIVSDFSRITGVSLSDDLIPSESRAFCQFVLTVALQQIRSFQTICRTIQFNEKRLLDLCHGLLAERNGNAPSQSPKLVRETQLPATLGSATKPYTYVHCETPPVTDDEAEIMEELQTPTSSRCTTPDFLSNLNASPDDSLCSDDDASVCLQEKLDELSRLQAHIDGLEEERDHLKSVNLVQRLEIRALKKRLHRSRSQNSRSSRARDASSDASSKDPTDTHTDKDPLPHTSTTQPHHITHPHPPPLQLPADAQSPSMSLDPPAPASDASSGASCKCACEPPCMPANEEEDEEGGEERYSIVPRAALISLTSSPLGEFLPTCELEETHLTEVASTPSAASTVSRPPLISRASTLEQHSPHLAPIIACLSNFERYDLQHVWKPDSGDLLLPSDGPLEHLADAFRAFLAEATQIFLSECKLLEIRSPVYVFGDLHGNYADLQFFMKKFNPTGRLGWAPHRMLFLGDYVDRGPHSVEVVTRLLAHKIRNPDKLILLRGNHETRAVCGNYELYGDASFRAQCSKLFGAHGEEIFEAFNVAFDAMPLCAVIDSQLFCTHGGIPRLLPGATDNRLEVIRCLPPDLRGREMEPPIIDLLWGDPSQHANQVNENGFGPNECRGEGVMVYDQRAVDAFLDRYHLTLILRGHEALKAGAQLCKKGKVFTIFSTSNYMGTPNSAACILCHEKRIRPVVYLPPAPSPPVPTGSPKQPHAPPTRALQYTPVPPSPSRSTPSHAHSRRLSPTPMSRLFFTSSQPKPE